MEKLLIADASEDLCLLLRQRLENQYQIRCCADGKAALEQLRQWKPKVMILDLRLPLLDGLSLLWAAQDDLPPVILTMTSDHSDYVIHSAVELGVGCVLYKPCAVRAILEHLKKLTDHMEDSNAAFTPRRILTEYLNQLSIPTIQNGQRYLLCAVPLFMQDSQQRLTKELYPAVGKCCAVSSESVEHSIRYCIRYAWQRRNQGAWEKYFPEYGDRCPSNLAFISRLAQLLQDDLQSCRGV